MAKRVYIDTSVVGGYFDEEFEFWTKIFFDSVRQGDFLIVISELLTEELKSAPKQTRTSLDQIPDEHKSYIESSKESNELANSYINSGIVGIRLSAYIQ